MSEWRPFYPSPGITSREQFGELLVLRGLTGKAVEVGTDEGLFAETLLKSWPGHLYCVDPWATLDDYKDDCINARDRDADFKTAMNRLAPYLYRVIVLRKLSEEAYQEFENESLDFVYLDANHNREHFEQDIQRWYGKVRQGGVFAGHDWNGDWLDHVQPVVRAFCEKINRPAYIVLGDAASWYMIKGESLIK